MVKDVEYRDYLFKLIVTLIVFVGLLGFLAETTYRGFFESIIKLAQSDEYSYIIISFLTITITFYLALKHIEISHSLRLSKIVFIVILLLSSIITYSLAQLDLEFKLQLMGFSFISIFIALLLLIYEPSRICEIMFFLTPLLLIPLPLKLIDTLTLILSKHIDKLVGAISGASIEPIRLSIKAACSGVIIVNPILVVTPLLVYIMAFSIDKPVRKITTLILSLSTTLLIGFLGILTRILILIYTTMKLGINHAYTLLQYSPSILYTIISTLIALYFVKKYLKFKEYPHRNLLDLSLKATWERITGILLLAVIIVSSVSLIIHVFNIEIGVSNITINANNVSDYLENPAKYLSTSKIVFTSSEYDAFLTRILGGLRAYRVLVNSTERQYSGYIELVDIPARLHTWDFYLVIQGYLVKTSWSSSINGVKVNFIVFEYNNQSSVLAYTIIPVIIKTKSRDFNLYTRVSLFNSGSINVTSELSSILYSIILEHLSEQGFRDISGLLNTLSHSLIYILCVFLLYSVILLIYKYKVRGAFFKWRISS
jgi:hypothetical protein